MAAGPRRWLKRLVPRSLLGRSLLIILLPLVLLEAVALQIFYGSHLDLISRRFADAIVGEISATLALMHRFPAPADRHFVLRVARSEYGLLFSLAPGARLHSLKSRKILGPMDNDLGMAMGQRLHLPFRMDWVSDPEYVLVRIQTSDGVLTVKAPRKRLYSNGVYLFVLWLVGTLVLVFTIAALFMRNQVRAIRRLAAAAEAFGLGRDVGAIRPEGAVEVRQAGVAFNRMRERIGRFLTQRTEMLAGVSHDLRTPLTRLRLALAMLPRDRGIEEDVAAMTEDVAEMNRMIGGYLAFARGAGAEPARPADLSAMLAEIAAGAKRAGTDVALAAPASLTLNLRVDAMRRAITNLVDNASRHAQRIALAATAEDGQIVQVTVDDDGPGIPPDRRESVFRPFESGAAGGIGLGLTIARDIVRAHGGEILLEDSPLGGLRARVRVPV